MIVVNELRQTISIARISRAMYIHRSFIYYNRTEHSWRQKSRVSEGIETEIVKIATDRTTYGYRRIWAMLRNKDVKVNVKTVRRIMRRHNLALPYAKHKNRTRERDLTKPDDINRLWETDTHYISTIREGMAHLMSIKDCFSKRWISYELSRSCTAKDCIMAVERAYAERFPPSMPVKLILRTDNGLQYIAGEFRSSMKILDIGHEYIQKHTPEDNSDMESFHSSLKTDCIWVNNIETFEDAKNLMEYAFTDYNTVRPHSSIDYLAPEAFERRWNESYEFREQFPEKKRKKHEKDIRRREEKKRRLKENVSFEAGKSVQN